MIRNLLASMLIVCGLVLGAPAYAQVVTVQVQPTPARAGEPVELTLTIAVPDCLGAESFPIQRVGQEIRIDFTINTQGGICGVPAPVVFRIIPLGGFEPGNYSVIARGTNLANAAVLGPASAGFIVYGAPQSIPTNASLAMMLLTLATLGVAALALRRR
ncbi:MAG: hypothetical protein ACT4NL_15110 [Pseudomarimonas sp.]